MPKLYLAHTVLSKQKSKGKVRTSEFTERPSSINSKSIDEEIVWS